MNLFFIFYKKYHNISLNNYGNEYYSTSIWFQSLHAAFSRCVGIVSRSTLPEDLSVQVKYRARAIVRAEMLKPCISFPEERLSLHIFRNVVSACCNTLKELVINHFHLFFFKDRLFNCVGWKLFRPLSVLIFFKVSSKNRHRTNVSLFFTEKNFLETQTTGSIVRSKRWKKIGFESFYCDKFYCGCSKNDENWIIGRVVIFTGVYASGPLLHGGFAVRGLSRTNTGNTRHHQRRLSNHVLQGIRKKIEFSTEVPKFVRAIYNFFSEFCRISGEISASIVNKNDRDSPNVATDHQNLSGGIPEMILYSLLHLGIGWLLFSLVDRSSGISDKRIMNWLIDSSINPVYSINH